MNYFEFYAGDYLRDTADLSLAEHGAYVLLMASYYSSERALPADVGSLHRIARAMSKAEQGAVARVAGRFFPVREDGLRHNDRADREICKAQKRINSARENGTQGGRPKKAKENPIETHEKPTGFQSDNPPETHSGEALHAPPVNQELPPTAGAEAPAPADPIFGVGLDFLKRKGIRETSARSFLGLLRKELHDDLTVAELLVEAERQDVSAPQAWLTQAAKQRKAQGKSNGYSTQSRNPSAVERIARNNAEAERRESAAAALEGEFRFPATG